MHVAIIAEILTKIGGAERVVQQLWDMFPEADIYTLFYDEGKCGEVFPASKIKTSILQKWSNRGIPKQFLVSKMPNAIEAFNFDAYDLVISSSSGFAHGAITKSDTVHISYVHAPMRYGWDYTHKYVQEKTSGWKKILKIPLWSTLKNLRTWDFTASSRSDIILANSKTTQNRISKYWKRKSTVLYPPVDIERFTVTSKHKNYYFLVSAIEGFKKIDIAVEAFINMPEKKLIIAGDGSDKMRLESLAKNANNVEFIGRISDKEVQKYMENMKAYIFPGLEDFGITPVEAMACGKPVIFYNKGGVRESVIDGETGIAFQNQTSKDIQDAVIDFEQRQNIFNPQVIRKRAEKFGSHLFVTQFKSILDTAIEDMKY